MNGSHNCRSVAGTARMPNAEARKVWLSGQHYLNADALKCMPGWTIGMARHHFGPRDGSGPKAFSVRARDAAAAEMDD
jgi:hypothetical protein